ncbi:ATP6V0B [Cordylochernes scorpioides]|uniref:ATP6V0B n=1 Tax=Cordylochernes scorpioides TaxID=51811 RepID=A0ABY6KUF6_9ARAC|nr:ATP6V0B [Cordylochernes scorpioides]
MMVKLGHIIGPLQQLCYAHGLHLTVMDVLYALKKERVVPEFVSATVNEAESDLSEDDNEDTSPFNVSLEKNINEVTKKARVVVKLCKRSPLKNEILLNYMRQDNRISTSMCLILDCRTRLDSLLNMLERLLSVKSALIDVNANVRLTDEDFDIMTQVISALKPFRAAVAAICRRDATLLAAEATVKFILEELQAQSHSLSKDLQNYFQKRILEERCNKTYLVLQYLHNPQAPLEKKKMVKDFSVKLLLRLKPLQEQMAEFSQSTGSRGRGRVESLGMSTQKYEDTVALRKFREQIKVELGAKDGNRRVLSDYMVDEVDLGHNRRGLTQMVKSL